MRISRVNFRHLKLPLETRYGDANGLKQHRGSLLLRIETDNGIAGWGETFAYAVNRQNCENVAAMLTGADARHQRPLVEQVARFDLRLAGAVDLALIDIVGKASGLSAAQLLGGAFRTAQPAYASLQNVTEDANVVDAAIGEAMRAMALGFRALKMKVGWHPVATDIEWVNAVIAALPAGVPIALDANRALDLAGARRLLAGITDLNRVMWFEEPIANTSLPAHGELRMGAAVPIAGAESMPIAMIEQAIDSRAMDIINPDLVGHGGFDRLRRLWVLCDIHGVRLVPHIFDGQIVRAGTVHFLATTPDWSERQAPFRAAPVEYDISVNALRDDLLRDSLSLDADGNVIVPDAPGLGIEINENLLERYAVMAC